MDMKLVKAPNLKSWVNSSSKVKGVMKILDKKPRTAREVSKILFISVNHTKIIINKLMDVEITEDGEEKISLVECVTPDRKRKKLFGLTEEGKEFLEDL